MAEVQNEREKSLTSGDERERLAQVFEQAPSLMALLREPNHRIVLANRAFQRLFGEASAIGRTAAEVMPQELSDVAREIRTGG
jgi:PAS domain S-box-containing protein